MTRLYVLITGVKNINQVANWATTELKYVYFIIFFAFIIGALVKRAWNALIMIFISFIVLGMFVLDPMLILKIVEWIAGLSR